MFTVDREILAPFWLKPLPEALISSCLDEDGRKDLQAIAAKREFPSKTPIYRRGDAPASVWIVVTGAVTAVAGNGHLLVHEGGPGDIFGLTETIAAIDHQSTLVADTPCSCVNIGREDLTMFLNRQPVVCIQLLYELSQRYSAWIRQIADT